VDGKSCFFIRLFFRLKIAISITVRRRPSVLANIEVTHKAIPNSENQIGCQSKKKKRSEMGFLT
jgi:hypothetical protein